MVALGNTSFGKALNDAHIQIYGWGDLGGNLSTNRVHGGNAPAGYDYNPNRIQFDQGVLYIERLPDTVQRDHIDWGFRIAPIFGADYRYTTAFGYASYQLLKQNREYGYDIPMAYGELFVPQIADGLLIRIGRFISLPDIEAQLAPNNYMYSHSPGLHLRQLHQHRSADDARDEQERVPAARRDRRQRHQPRSRRPAHHQSLSEPALS